MSWDLIKQQKLRKIKVRGEGGQAMMTKFFVQRENGVELYTRYPIVARALGLAAVQPLGRVRRASKGILHTRG